MFDNFSLHGYTLHSTLFRAKWHWQTLATLCIVFIFIYYLPVIIFSYTFYGKSYHRIKGSTHNRYKQNEPVTCVSDCFANKFCCFSNLPRVLLESPNINHIFLESSSGPLTQQSPAELTEPEPMPKPKPRTAKSPDSHMQLTSPLDDVETDRISQISPLREQTLDIETVQVGISPSDNVIDSYLDRKKFWETVSRESEIKISKKKRMSLFEEPSLAEKQILAKKRTSVHEVSAIPPIPKPRSTLQSTQSFTETDKEDGKRQFSESSISESSSSLGQTELTKISESDKSCEIEIKKPLTEYQASFQPPSQVTEQKSKIRSEELKSKADLQKTDSLDSEFDGSQVNQSQGYENTGYISDSGDVEHYISDSEIEDRVPQIRERQMSIAVPVAATRKTIYERSASLPTEDLYEVSARSVKLRKQYYEQQIKKEMIVEQLTSEVEEEPSPERKTLKIENDYEDDDLEKQTPGIRSAPEKIDDEYIQGDMDTVRNIAKTVDEALSITAQELVEEQPKSISVKDLASSFEKKQLGSVIAGQKIGKPADIKSSVAEKHKPKNGKTKMEFHEIADINDFQEIVYDKEDVKSFKEIKNEFDDADKTVSDFKTHKSDVGLAIQTNVEFEQTHNVKHKFSESQTHKSTKTPREKRSSTESDQSFSSEKSVDVGSLDELQSHPIEIITYKEDSTSKPSDSMEVHVDKSEMEDSEKITDVDQDVTDLETKSLESLNAIEENVLEVSIPKHIAEDSNKYDACQKNSDAEKVIPHTVFLPEEHIQDTVWEVSVESQPEKFEERVFDMRIGQHIKEKPLDAEEICVEDKFSDIGRHTEKDDDLSGSVRDESDLGSEIHQDHSDSYASDKIKSDSHSDIEKIILESLHQQKVDPEEAKRIANDLIEEIEAELQKRSSVIEAKDQVAANSVTKTQVPEYLRQLAEAKGLDEREVELVESVLARRQRELAKLARGDTDASSMEITDEDLRYSGAEIDYSNILEQQIDQLEHEKSLDDMRSVYDNLEKECAKDHEDKTVKVEKVRDQKVKEFVIHKDHETDEEGKISGYRTDIKTRTTESSIGERRLIEERDAIVEEDESVLNSITEEVNTRESKRETAVSQVQSAVSEGKFEHSISEAWATEQNNSSVDVSVKKVDIVSKDSKIKLDQTATSIKDTVQTAGTYSSDIIVSEKLDDGEKEKHVVKEQSVKEEQENYQLSDDYHTEEKKIMDDLEILKTVDKKHTKTSSSTILMDQSHEVSTFVTNKVLGEVVEADLEKLIAGGTLTLDKEKGDQMKPISEDAEIVVSEHEKVVRTGSTDSKSSQDESKSPEEQLSTCSSGRKGDSDTTYKVSEKCDVVFRKIKPHNEVDSSSSSGNLKIDRKSGMDYETYSSSGESHYHSFELDSAKSRPCSSDVEGLVAAGSSEYESALTSQDISAPSHITSADYHTAVSTLSSKESMKSLDSESSGNLASIEVSEASETLVPSTFEADGDILEQDDWIDDQKRLVNRQSTEFSDSEVMMSQGVGGSVDLSEDDSLNGSKSPMDGQSRMKRSHEMTFQPEPKGFVPESPQFEGGDERFATSLDDGSVLSISLSSTSSVQLPTVVELSKADSERLEGSMTVSGTSEQLSLEELENLPRGSRESLLGAHTPTRQTSSDMSTSTNAQFQDMAVSSVTMTTSTVAENGIQNVSTQVTSEAHTPIPEQSSLTEHVSDAKQNGMAECEFDDIPKKKGHRRQDSTSFVPVRFPLATSRSEIEKKIHSDLAESDKYTNELSFKEVSSDEKKDVDETEKDIFYETEADQGFHRDVREGRYLETESDSDPKEMDILDSSRPQSQISKSDSEKERASSVVFSDDRPDSELAELAKQHSSEGVTDPIERPISPELLEDGEMKDDTAEFSSEGKPSIGDLEQECTLATERFADASNKKEIVLDKIAHKKVLEKKDSQGKLSGTSSEKSSFEESEADAVFGMVAHSSPAHKAKLICPILEDADAEKHELETRERAQKEYELRRAQMKDLSPGFIPDIKITQHMAPLIDHGFHYPDLEYEKQLREEGKLVEEPEEVEEQDDDDQNAHKSTPQTPASNSSKSSEDTDQGREYTLEDSGVSIPEEPEGTILDDKGELAESKSDLGTVVEKTLYESDKDTSRSESQNSDSFEMLEKPDLIDDFVVIEEVAREAHEFDTEGRSMKITGKKKPIKKVDVELEEYLVKSAPSTTTTKMTDIKYYPDGSSSDELGFEFEDSPPQANQQKTEAAPKTGKDYVNEYDRELEANKKWIEQQFQGDQAAMIAAGYGYEMEFERGPLEDIKEEDINDFDPTSSRVGSLSSQKESGGSLGSVKDSFSSTPEYDVLAGRKYFTRSGEHDDVSMSSLQEFENLERAMSLENRRCHQGSQDSLSNGSFGRRYYAGRSGQGDDVSVSSLKEFEGLEKACIDAHKIEIKIKEEEAMLAQIDEGQESIASETESCETMSGTDKKLIPDSDEEDYEKRMFEIDEIIKQAQTNVERFIELKECEKTESIGRGDSFEEVSKVPDLDLDTPAIKSTTKVQWADNDDAMATSTDSLDIQKPSHHDSTDSLDQKTAGDVMTASTDSIEFQAQKSSKDNIMTDSIEIKDDADKSYMVSSDSLELHAGTSTNAPLSDSIDEDGSRIGGQDQSSSSGKDFSSSAKDEIQDIKYQTEYMLGSTDSLDPSSSTATHATYQYDTDSVFSGSFTSGGSNTMVSSTDTIEHGAHGREAVDLAAAVRKVWFDDDSHTKGKQFSTEYVDDASQPYVTEVIEPCEDDGVYSHTIHRRVELPPEIRKISFKGADAEEQMKKFLEDFGEGEHVEETEEVDKDGNVHIKKVVQKKVIIKDSSGKNNVSQAISDPKIQEYFQKLTPDFESQGVIRRTYTDRQGTKTIYTQQFGSSDSTDSDSAVRDLLTSIAGDKGSLLIFPHDYLFFPFSSHRVDFDEIHKKYL